VNWRATTLAPTLPPTPENGEAICREVLQTGVSTFGRCHATGCSERVIRECHTGLLRIRLLLKNTKARRLANWKADVSRANGVRREVVCMLSRMVRVRDRIVKSSLKHAERSLRDCRRVSSAVAACVASRQCAVAWRLC